jgi:transcriptional regulator NrdR family protein
VSASAVPHGTITATDCPRCQSAATVLLGSQGESQGTGEYVVLTRACRACGSRYLVTYQAYEVELLAARTGGETQ